MTSTFCLHTAGPLHGSAQHPSFSGRNVSRPLHPRQQYSLQQSSCNSPAQARPSRCCAGIRKSFKAASHIPDSAQLSLLSLFCWLVLQPVPAAGITQSYGRHQPLLKCQRFRLLEAELPQCPQAMMNTEREHRRLTCPHCFLTAALSTLACR